MQRIKTQVHRRFAIDATSNIKRRNSISKTRCTRHINECLLSLVSLIAIHKNTGEEEKIQAISEEVQIVFDFIRLQRAKGFTSEYTYLLIISDIPRLFILWCVVNLYSYIYIYIHGCTFLKSKSDTAEASTLSLLLIFLLK